MDGLTRGVSCSEESQRRMDRQKEATWCESESSSSDSWRYTRSCCCVGIAENLRTIVNSDATPRFNAQLVPTVNVQDLSCVMSNCLCGRNMPL